MPKIYYAHFDSVHGFRMYKIIAETKEEAKRIALAYDKSNTVSGDRLVIFCTKEIIVDEVIEKDVHKDS